MLTVTSRFSSCIGHRSALNLSCVCDRARAESVFREPQPQLTCKQTTEMHLVNLALRCICIYIPIYRYADACMQ